jgi:sirohydrochlorin cobaltochelatase
MVRKALLVVSFGTSYNDTCVRSISAAEDSLASAFPDRELHRAYTSHGVRKILFDRDGRNVDSVEEALGKLADHGYTDLLVQPLHIIPGIEYEMVITALTSYENRFDTVRVGRPLLAGQHDLQAVLEVLSYYQPENHSNEALLLMGHGTRHSANILYWQLEKAFQESGLTNIFIATVEGTPTLEDVIPRLKSNGYHLVTLMPFMLVAGDHAQNDMASENNNSWKSILTHNGFDVRVEMVGLGEMEGIRRLYIDHAFQATSLEIILKGRPS